MNYNEILKFILSSDTELFQFFKDTEVIEEINSLIFSAKEIEKTITLNTINTTEDLINEYKQLLNGNTVSNRFFIKLIENESPNLINRPIDLICEKKVGKILPIEYIFDRTISKEKLEELFIIAIQNYIYQNFSEFKEYLIKPSLDTLMSTHEMVINMEELFPTNSLILIMNRLTTNEILLEKSLINLMEYGLFDYRLYKNDNMGMKYSEISCKQISINNSKYKFDEEQLRKISKILHSANKEISPISKYLMTYQIVEMLIDLIFNGFILELKNTNPDKINSWDFKNLLNDITNESFKISRLLNSFLNNGVPQDLQDDFVYKTNELIDENSLVVKNQIDSLAKAIYFIRNTYAHAQREIDVIKNEELIIHLNNLFIKISNLVVKNFDLNKGVEFYRNETLKDYI